MDVIRKVAFCPHCGNRSPQSLVHSQYGSGVAWHFPEEKEEDIPVGYFVASCETCNQVLLYREVGNILDGKDFLHAEFVYPESGELHNSVPKRIAEIYAEATRIKNLAPNAFAVQIRRALEALCENRGAKKGVLQKQLKELADRGEIPSTLAEATSVLRLLGNVGAHAASESVRPWQVYAMDEFFRAVVEYVYVAPSKLEDFKNSLNRPKNEKPDETKGDA
jgi:Domain of unknown function (DUF4145)